MGRGLKLPRYVHAFTDRHGKPRYYLRRSGCKRLPLPGTPWSPEFMEAYAQGMEAAPTIEIGAGRTMPGTVNEAIIRYLGSTSFRQFAKSTQDTRRATLERFREQHGDKRLAPLEPRHVAKILGQLAPNPQKSMLKALRGLMAFALTEGLITHDPTRGVKPVRVKDTGGFQTWTHDQIASYRARHALGTRARLAFELLICTGQRRSDVIRMGRQHVREGILSIRQQKTRNLVEIPLLPELREALEAMPRTEHLTFLSTEAGKPFTPAGFGNWFRDRCDEAGIPKGYAAHGLRKAAATRHADAGATAHELMAWFGWTSITEAERYTKAANRRRLSEGMLTKLETRTSSGKPD